MAPHRRFRTGPEPVLQSLGLHATEVAGGVGHPIHSSAVSPQPHIVAASQLSQQGLIRPGKHTRLPITGVVRVHLPGAGVVRGRVASDLPDCSASARQGHRFGRGGVGGGEFGSRIRQDVGIHWIWDRATVLLMERRRGARSGEEPSRAMHRDWLSVKMATDVDRSRCWLIQSTAICMALLSSSKEQVNAAPRSSTVPTTSGAAGSPVVMTTPAPPLVVPALADPSV